MKRLSIDREQQSDRVPRPRIIGVFVVVIISLLMPFMWYVILYREPLQSLKQISSETLAAQERAIGERRAALVSLQAIDMQYKSLDAAVIRTILDAIPGTKLLPELIVNITQIIQGSNGALEEFAISESQPAKEVGGPKMMTYRMQVSISDMSYEAMKQLLKVVYQNGRVLSIRSLDYIPDDSTVSLTIEAYSLSGK